MIARRRSRIGMLIRVVLGLVAASTLLVPAHAGGQEAPGLGGFQGTAASYGLKATYFPEGLLPTGAPVDLGSPDALVTVATGPATFARASIADPGDIIANPNALLGAANPDAPRVPEYPYRISASSATGDPEAESNPAPGLSAKVRAGPRTATAESTTPRFEAPAIATLGSMAALATTSTDGSTVTVRARTEISSFDLLGILTIDSIVSDVTATSDGETTTADGGTTITGASLLGEPVIIDADGVHTDPEADEPGIPLIGDLGGLIGLGGADPASLLADAGLDITVAGPREMSAEDTTRLAASGLRIDLAVSDESVPLLSDLIDLLPPIENPLPGVPSVEDVIAVVEANHLVTLELGGAAVDLGARPAFSFEPSSPPVGSGTVTPPGATGGFTNPGTPSITGSPGTSGPGSSPASTPTLETAASPISSLSTGLGVAAVLALLLQPLVGYGIAQAAAAILAADQPEMCPREGQ